MQRPIRFYFILVLFALLSACASNSVTPIGSYAPRPVPPDAPVYIYSSEQEIKAPFKVVGMLSYTNPGKYRILSLGDVIPALKKQVRKAEANGLIIDQTRPIKSGIISTGIGVTGRAIIVER